MKSPDSQTRRAMVASLAALPLARDALASRAGVLDASRSTTLVALFSRTGNTRVVAGLIRRAVGADFSEIRPAVPYPEEYLATVELSKRERDRGVEPRLESVVLNMATWLQKAASRK